MGFVGFFKNRIFSPVVMFAGLIFASPIVQAQYPDLTAAPLNGSASCTDFSCTNPADDGPFTDLLSVTFSNQINGNFDVSVAFTESDGTKETDTGSGFLSHQAQSNLQSPILVLV